VQLATACGVLAVACVLLAGALSTCAAPSSFVSTLQAVGVPPAIATRSWWAVPCAEFAAAAALLTDPGSSAAQVLTLAVFAGFLVVGLVALRSGRSIACACFGGRSAATLGWHQVAQVVPVAAVLLALQYYELSWSPRQGLGLTAAALAAAAVALAAPAVPLWRETRAMRRSLRATRLDVRRLAMEADDG
jgi:hypothetical protein